MGSERERERREKRERKKERGGRKWKKLKLNWDMNGIGGKTKKGR